MSDVPMKTASNKEIEIAALTKQYVLRNIDSHKLGVYQITVSKDRKMDSRNLTILSYQKQRRIG